MCFGSDAESCPNDNLYRIIGVFGDKVKLIKYDYANSNLLGTTGAYYGAYSYGSSNYKGSNYLNIASYYWNSNTGINTWSESNLNGTYLTNLGTWANKIVESTWKVGGNTYANILTSAMNVVYQNEIVSPSSTTTYQAKIGLIYVSDYGYAASPTYWTYKGSDTATTDYRVTISENWMYMGLYEWTISRRSDDSHPTCVILPLGQLGSNIVGGSNLAIRPCFYLNSSVQYLSGVGTSGDPIVIN